MSKEYIKTYAYPIISLVVVLAASFFIFKNKVTTDNGQVKGATTIDSGTIQSTISDSLSNKVAKVDSLIAAATGIPYQPDMNPLHTINGQFIDVNNDGKKEWVYRENWQGASGWSDQYSIYQLTGAKLNNIFDELNSTSVLFFQNGDIYKAEPYYGDFSQPMASVNTLLITRYQWDGQKYQPAGQLLYPLADQSTGN